MFLRVFSVAVLLSSVSVVWSQQTCSGTWQLHHGACYHYFNETYSWFSAKTVCTTLDAFLAEDKDPEAHQFLRGLLPVNNTMAWIGIQDFTEEGQYVWSNSKKPVEVAFWNVGEPVDMGEDDCVGLDAGKGGGWFDGNCEDQHISFICQKSLPQESVIG